MKEYRIVEISEDGIFLGVERGFLIVKKANVEVGKIALDSIMAVVCTGNYTTFSSALLPKLSDCKIAFVVCDKKTKIPSSFLLPLSANYRQGDIMGLQGRISKAKNKYLWARIIKAKLLQQANVMNFYKKDSEYIRLKGLSTMVKPDDIENLEARGAMVYWKGLMGKEFIRDRCAENENLLFNYAYTVLRACVIRSICAAGLHPSLGIHHKSSTNNFRLADDLMEVFRALADVQIKKVCDSYGAVLNVETKKLLCRILTKEVKLKDKSTNIMQLSNKLAISLAQYYLKERDDIDIEVISSKNLLEYEKA